MRNVIYTILYYKNDPIKEEFYKNYIIKAIKLFFEENANNFDFEIIDYISKDVEDLFFSLTEYWNRNSNKLQTQNELVNGLNMLYHDSLLNTKSNKLHQLKVWVMKYKVLEYFYKSSYENMLYVDADMLMDWSTAFNFDNKNNPSLFLHKAKRPGKPNVIIEHYLNKKLNERTVNGLLYLSKKCPFNLTKIINLSRLIKSCKITPAFLNDECFINSVLLENEYKVNIHEYIPDSFQGFNYTTMGTPSAKKLWEDIHAKNGKYMFELINYYNSVPNKIKQQIFKSKYKCKTKMPS